MPFQSHLPLSPQHPTNAPPVLTASLSQNAATCAMPLLRETSHQIPPLLKAPEKMLAPPRGSHQLPRSLTSPEVTVTTFRTSPATPAGALKYLTWGMYASVRSFGTETEHLEGLTRAGSEDRAFGSLPFLRLGPGPLGQAS